MAQTCHYTVHMQLLLNDRDQRVEEKEWRQWNQEEVKEWQETGRIGFTGKNSWEFHTCILSSISKNSADWNTQKKKIIKHIKQDATRLNFDFQSTNLYWHQTHLAVNSSIIGLCFHAQSKTEMSEFEGLTLVTLVLTAADLVYVPSPQHKFSCVKRAGQGRGFPYSL